MILFVSEGQQHLSTVGLVGKGNDVSTVVKV